MFYTLLPESIALLQRNRRVTYRRLAYVFAVAEALLHEGRNEAFVCLTSSLTDPFA